MYGRRIMLIWAKRTFRLRLTGMRFGSFEELEMHGQPRSSVNLGTRYLGRPSVIMVGPKPPGGGG